MSGKSTTEHLEDAVSDPNDLPTTAADFAGADVEIARRVEQRVAAELAAVELTEHQLSACRAVIVQQESGAVLAERGIDVLAFAEWRVQEVHG